MLQNNRVDILPEYYDDSKTAEELVLNRIITVATDTGELLAHISDARIITRSGINVHIIETEADARTDTQIESETQSTEDEPIKESGEAKDVGNNCIDYSGGRHIGCGYDIGCIGNNSKIYDQRSRQTR